MSFSTLIQRAFLNRSLDGLSGLYQRLIPLHTGASNVSALETVGNVAPASVEKLFQLGALSAEHGFGAFLSQSNNANPFRDLDDATKRNLDTDPVTLNWSQLSTGSMPGLDQFELLFYSESLDKLYYKMNVGALAPADKNYQYKMPRNEVQMLVNALQRSGYLAKDKLVLIVKGVASGSGAGGAVSSGPYYGNAEIFTLKLGSKKYATIAVDSSGSNLETDKGNLRIQAAHDMLKNMGARNAEVISGAQAGKLLSVAALEFDSSPSVLSDFFDPEKLAGLEIFKSVDSEGGTDIAAAIRRSTSLLKAFQPPANPPVVDVNRPHMYMLTDMNNNEGPAVVNTAVNEAKAQNIEVHFGHLKPLEVKSSAVSGMINGDPVRLAKVAEPLDSLISAILATGGTYSVIENAGAQKAWVKLMDELSVMDPYTRTSVNLPLDVQVYGFARNVGNPEPVYVFTAPTTGEVTITFDGKGSFVPNLNVGSTSGQTPLGRDLYSLPFKVTAGQTYQININEPVAAAGVYSIVLRQTATGGPVVTPPTMTLNPIADVTEGTAPVISGTTTNVADGTPVTITFTTSKATLAKATLVVNSTVSGNAFSASGPTTLPQGTTTVTVDIAGLGIAPITQAFTVTPKVQPPVTQAATAVPVDNPFALIALAVVIAGFAGYRHRKQQR